MNISSPGVKALDIWNVLTSQITTKGSMGKALNSYASASDVLQLESAGEVTRTGDAVLTKKKEFLIALAGTYRVTFEVKYSINAANAVGQVFKNGVAHGASHGTVADHSAYQEFTDDLVFAAGDLCQLYIRPALGTETASAKNFRVKGTLALLVGEEQSV